MGQHTPEPPSPRFYLKRLCQTAQTCGLWPVGVSPTLLQDPSDPLRKPRTASCTIWREPYLVASSFRLASWQQYVLRTLDRRQGPNRLRNDPVCQGDSGDAINVLDTLCSLSSGPMVHTVVTKGGAEVCQRSGHCRRHERHSTTVF